MELQNKHNILISDYSNHFFFRLTGLKTAFKYETKRNEKKARVKKRIETKKFEKRNGKNGKKFINETKRNEKK
jgi:hypothetical protein